MPTRNRVNSLKCAVNSVLTQTYQSIELIIVDDNSEDDTPNYLQGLVKIDSRVKYFRNTETKGACYSRNLAISNSSGEFVTGLDDDDEFKSIHVEALLNYWSFLSKFTINVPSCIYSQCIARVDGVEVCSSNRPLRVEYYDLFKLNCIGNQIFAPRSHFINVGLFDENMPAWQDLEFFYRVLEKYGTAKLLDIPTYVFDNTPRDDRISFGQKNRILNACERMIKLHARSSRDSQYLLLQVYSDYYGFLATFEDLIRFSKIGFWGFGYKVMLKKFLKNYLKMR